MTDTLPNRLASPRFERPPVEEVALAVFFRPESIGLMDLSRLADRWADTFPVQRELKARPPVPPEGDVQAGRSAEFVLSTRVGNQLRLWLQNDRGGGRAIQIQADRLVQNWRRTEGVPYPTYATLRPEFEATIADLMEVQPELLPVQCEVTYSNPIDFQPGRSLGALEDVLSPWSGRHSTDFLPVEEQVRLNLTYRIEPDGRFRGRLYANTVPLRRPPGRARLQMVGRVLVDGQGTDAVVDALDLAHEWVVHGFVSLTTPEARQQWGMQ